MAAKSIIDIEVKDEHFRRFEESFKRYQENLISTPVEWKKAAREGGTLADHLKSMNASLNQQMQLLQRVADGSERTAESTGKIAANWKDIENSTRKTRENTKEDGGFISGVGGGMLQQFPWARRALNFPGGAAAGAGFMVGSAVAAGIKAVIGSNIQFGLGLAGLGGNLFGLDTLAAAGATGRRATTGLGIGFGAMQSARNVFGTTFDPNSVMGAISTGRGDITSDAATALISLGIGGNDTGDSMLATRQRVRELAKNTPEHMLGPLMQSRMLDKLGFSLQDLRRLRNQSDSEFNEDSALEAKRRGQMDVSDANLRNWQKFHVTLSAATMKLESGLLQGLTKVAPLFEQVSEGLSDAINNLLKSDGFANVVRWIADGLKDFAKYIGSGKFQSDMEDLGVKVVAIARAIGDAVDWIYQKLPWITNPVGTAATSVGVGQGTANALAGGASMAWKYNPINPMFVPNLFGLVTGKANASSLGAGGGGSAEGYMGGASQLRGDIKAMMDKGWSYEQAVGIVANLKEESAGNIAAVGDSGTAYGLAQWRGSRQTDFHRLFGKPIQQSTREEQLAFIDWELRNSERTAGNALMQQTTSEGAFAAFAKYYERPADVNLQSRLRSGTAQAISAAHPRDALTRVDINIVNQTPASVNVTTNQVRAAQ